MNGHNPVMIEEVLHFINVRDRGVYIDATVGGGGHAKEILSRGGRVLGIDCDPKSLEVAKRKLEEFEGKVKFVQGNFANIAKIARDNGFEKVDGILFDLGVASFQLEDPLRGLSFLRDGPLDMRLDGNLGITASDLVNSLTEKQLKRVFWEYSQEKDSGRIAREIVRERQKKRIETTRQLIEIVEKVKGRAGRISPSTKVFMALRIAVNTEFENLEAGLLESVGLLKTGGRLVVVSFHSGEDRIVKDFFKTQDELNIVRTLTKKLVMPSEKERLSNPRSRSAKMRVGEKNRAD